jgi:tetratricopeptide (TPR) repeat protein
MSRTRGAIACSFGLVLAIAAARAGNDGTNLPPGPPPAPAPPGKPPAPKRAGHAALAEARFQDACLGKYEAAEALYKKALEAGLPPLEEAEAIFGLARTRILLGRKEPGSAALERLAERIGDGSIRPWPQRARKALDRLAIRSADPFQFRARGEGVFSLDVTAEPLVTLLRGLVPKTGVGVAFDESIQPSFTVTAKLEEVSFEELMDKLVGKQGWRRVGESMVIGEIAKDGEAFERPFRFEALRDAADREASGILCTRRISATFPGTPFAAALAKLDEVAGVKIEIDAAVRSGRARTVRMFVEEVRVDEALDLFVVPLGLAWQIEGGKVAIRERREHAE